MSILTTPTIDLTTVEGKTAATVATITSTAKMTYQQLLRAQNETSKLVWKNRYGLTPQQVCDGLGTNAAALFNYHGDLTDLILKIENDENITPTGISVPTNAFTKNEDGTVTILSTPYVPAA